MKTPLPELEEHYRYVKSGKDAAFLLCVDCGTVWGGADCIYPMGLRSTKYLHENGTGHKCAYVALKPRGLAT